MMERGRRATSWRHEAESFAFLEVHVRGVPEDIEFVRSFVERIELGEELLFCELPEREATLDLVVSIHAIRWRHRPDRSAPRWLRRTPDSASRYTDAPRSRRWIRSL